VIAAVKQIVIRTPLVGPSLRKARRWMAAADRSLGRRFYADNDAFSYHLRGQLALRRIRSRVAYVPRQEGPFSGDELRRRGLVLLPGLYAPDLVETIRRRVRETFDDPARLTPRQRPAADGRQYSWYIAELATVIPEIEALLTPGLVASIEEYYRAHLAVKAVKCWRNLHVPPEAYREREVYSNRWHCDATRPPGLLKLFYLVDDVCDEDGPLLVQPRPRTRELVRMGFGGRNDYRLTEGVMEDPKHMVKLTGPAGTVALYTTTRCLHRASRPREGRHRDIIQLQLVPSTQAFSPGWLDGRRTRLSSEEQGRVAND